MNLKQIDITVIINCHREYDQVLPTLASAHAARRYAEERNLSIETLVIADATDDKMRETLQRHLQSSPYQIDRIVETSHSDLGAARNTGAQEAQGTFLAFLDGDDLFGPSWLQMAYEYLKNKPTGIAHPEVCLFFDADPHWWRHIDSESCLFKPREMLTHNYWTALSFARKELYLSLPYIACKSKGYGFEDWHWNCETLNAGYNHVAVPKTLHMIRVKKSGSMNADFRQNRALLAPTSFFVNQKWMLTEERSSLSSNCYALLAKILMRLIRFPSLLRFVTKLPGIEVSFPNWALSEMNSVRKSEKLLPENTRLLPFRFYQYKKSNLAKKYPEILRQILQGRKQNCAFSLTFQTDPPIPIQKESLVFCLQKPRHKDSLVDLSPLAQKDRFFIFCRACLDLNATKIILDGPMIEFLELYGDNISKTKAIEMHIQTAQDCLSQIAALDKFITTYKVSNKDIKNLLTEHLHIDEKKVQLS